MSVYITRHGKTDWNIKHKINGKTDIDLNAEGIKQAEETREKLMNESIDFIICSPLKRARQTADIISRKRNIPITYDDRISERDYGELEGKTHKEFDFRGFWNYTSNVNYNNSEDINSFFNRVYIFLDEIRKKYPEKDILLVTHGGVSIAVNCYFKGIPQDGNLLNVGLKNCECLKYEFEKEKDEEMER